MPHELLTDGQVLRRVRDFVSKGCIKWTHHAEDQMAMRGYDKDQVKKCLLSGQFTENPHQPNRGPIEYKFKMFAVIEGRKIEVVASLNPDTKVFVITAIDPDKP